MDRQDSRTQLIDTYYTFEEFVETNRQYWDDATGSGMSVEKRGGQRGQSIQELFEDVERWIKDGWEEGVQAALPIAKHALETVEQEIEQVQYQAEWLMSGAEVDIGRYLQGVPECMIEYEQTRVSKVGKVVTVCASVGALANFTPEQIMRRGATVIGLVMALEECQHSVELWLDSTVTNYRKHGRGGIKTATTRVLLKGANDMLDPSRVAYALGHPSVLRVLTFASRCNYPDTWKRYLEVPPFGSMMGGSCDPVENLPDGTIYLPALGQDRNVLDSERFVVQTLKDLELL